VRLNGPDLSAHLKLKQDATEGEGMLLGSMVGFKIRCGARMMTSLGSGKTVA
jgi:hypothetical protein